MLYNPTELEAMQIAFRSAEKALRFAYPEGMDGAARTELAKAVIEAAVDPTIDPFLLCMSALRRIEPKAAA